MSHLIEIRDLKKIYAQGEEPVHALDGVSIDIDEGEFVVREVDDMKGEVEGGGGLFRGGGREERGLEGDALHLGTGGAKDADGELRIKPA